MTAGSPPVGSAAEEAARLFSAAQEWLRLRTAVPVEGIATGAPECSVCPLCQGISAVRHIRPETVEHLFDATASLVAALRTTVGEHGSADGPGPARRPHVEHIDVRED